MAGLGTVKVAPRTHTLCSPPPQDMRSPKAHPPRIVVTEKEVRCALLRCGPAAVAAGREAGPLTTEGAQEVAEGEKFTVLLRWARSSSNVARR
jgi:hypothetical protein